ncbi:MAG: hypothetical protein NTW69_00055 [Chloroflexi bacterium]|nr:hypothetical protein [Chloroflexota bacterium]
MEVNPNLIVLLSALAAVSFLVKKSTSWYVRVPMIIILIYFAVIYAYISVSPLTQTNMVIVRIGLIFLFANISIQNFSWAIFIRMNQAIKAGRK